MGPAHIPAFLFGTLITSFAFGIAFTLFIKSVGTILRKRRKTGKLNLPLVVPSVVIFLLATVNVIGLWVNIYMAFVIHGANPESYLGLIRTPAKTVIQTGQVGAILLADALVVYRTFVIWNNNYYIIVLPCMTFVATFTAGVSFVNLQHHTDVQTSVFAKKVTQWTVAFLLSSFFTTVYSTAAITYKLLSSQVKLRKHGIATGGGGISGRVLRILVESAALYSLNHLLYAVLYEVKNQVEITPSFLEASIASITCSLIIVRSEKVIYSPDTLPSFAPSNTMVAKPFTSGKYSGKQEGKVFALNSMEDHLDVTRTVSHNEEFVRQGRPV